MSIKKIELSWISTSDFKKAREFFEKKLGLHVHVADEKYGWLELVGRDGGMYLGVGAGEGPESPIKPGQNAVVTFTTDDLVATKADLERKGVKFIGDVVEVPGQVKLAMFMDEDGSKFHLVEKLNK